MQRRKSRNYTLIAILGLVMVFASTSALAQYNVTVLASDVNGFGQFDSVLINAWGLAWDPQDAPDGEFWVSAEGGGYCRGYDERGILQSLFRVEGRPGLPTGIVHNSSLQNFRVEGFTSLAILATLNGTIQAYTPNFPVGSEALAQYPGAVYTGLAISQANDMIYAVDKANNKIDMYDGTFNRVGSFTDTGLPKGAVPFGIQDINGQLYVTFVAANGGASGAVDVFTEQGVFVKRLIAGKPLNQPWGVAMAPGNFGALSNTLLVANNTDAGTINGFDPSTGKYVGTVTGANGKPIKIPQLRGIAFSDTNQLFWTAGPDKGLKGAFGSISPK